MARSFDELRNKMSPAARRRAEEKAARMMAKMPPHESRQAKGKVNRLEDVGQMDDSRWETVGS